MLETQLKHKHAMKLNAKVIDIETIRKILLIFEYPRSSCDYNILISLAKVDCKWGPYGNWSACTKSCGGGFQTRLRDIVQQAQHGGAKCDGESTDLRVCAEHACPSNQCFYIYILVKLRMNYC